MAKSKETFGKKEKEQKRLKKRQEKEEKKVERQSHSKNGNNLSEMLAYMDENGNLSSTPPDPKRKLDIKVEDIQIGVRKVEEEEEELLHTGTVTMYNDSRGYGFIKDSKRQDSIFVHANSLSIRIKEGDKVSFEVEKGPKGKIAVNVQKA